MNYNLVQREVKTLGEDLTELGGSIIAKTEEPSVPAILAELTYAQQRLSALLSYISGSV